MEPLFFASQALWRKWLEKNHARASECLVGYWKKATGKASIDWNESVDEALCFGWIDGVRKSLGAESFTIRFTPRKRGSIWSPKNVKRVGELAEAGLMHASGLAVFEARKADSTSLYFHEQEKPPRLTPDQERIFRKNRDAWKAWEGKAPYYRKAAAWWVIGAKQEATRLRRLDILIAYSEKGEKVPPLRPPPGSR